METYSGHTEANGETTDLAQPVALQDRTDLETEIQAMQSVARALEPLEAAGQRRVLEWAVARFSLAIPTSSVHRSDSGPQRTLGQAPPEFTQFVDLYDLANPTSDYDRALVAAYWIQVIQGNDAFTSFAANELLRDVGTSVSNIAETLTRLQKKTPALARQVSKSGKTKQARKTYKLTAAGIKTVELSLSVASELPE